MDAQLKFGSSPFPMHHPACPSHSYVLSHQSIPLERQQPGVLSVFMHRFLHSISSSSPSTKAGITSGPQRFAQQRSSEAEMHTPSHHTRPYSTAQPQSGMGLSGGASAQQCRGSMCQCGAAAADYVQAIPTYHFGRIQAVHELMYIDEKYNALFLCRVEVARTSSPRC